jgi:hypothetical protein
MVYNWQEMFYWILADHPNGTAPSLRRTLPPLLVLHPISKLLRMPRNCVHPRIPRSATGPAPHQPRLLRRMLGKYLPSSATSRRTAFSTHKWAPREASVGTPPSQVRGTLRGEEILNSFTPFVIRRRRTPVALIFERLIDWPKDSPTDWLIDWLTHWMTDRLAGWMNDW